MSVYLDRLLARERRDLFVPLSFRLSARLEQADWEEMVEDSVYTTFALRNGQNLFKADGVINWFDTHLEAEAAGAKVERDEMGRVTQQLALPDSVPDASFVLQQGQIPTALDVARRLCDETLDKTSVLGYVTGIRTLLAHLFGEEEGGRLSRSVSSGEILKEDRDVLDNIVQISLQTVRTYCEAGAGGLLVAEEHAIEDPALLKIMEPIFNVANYYGVPPVLLSRHPLPPHVRREALQAGFRYVAAPGADRTEDAEERTCAVPIELCIREDAPVEDWVREQLERAETARIYVSEWELPTEANPENLISLGGLLNG